MKEIKKENYKQKKLSETFIINLIAIALPVIILLGVFISNLISLWG